MMSTLWLYQSFIPHHLAYLHNSFKVKALFTKLTISQGLDQVFLVRFISGLTWFL